MPRSLIPEPEPSRLPQLVLAAAITCTIMLVLVGVFVLAHRPGGPLATGQRGRAKSSLLQRSESFLRQRANDPGSVQVVGVRYRRLVGPNAEPREMLVWVAFRERNQFGAMEYRELVLSTWDGDQLNQVDAYLSYRGGDGWSDTVPP